MTGTTDRFATVSIAANVAHSYVPPAAAPTGWSPQPGAVVGAVFWPVALFMAVEIVARTMWPAGRRWVLLRYAGLLPVAVVAAMVSYRHLAGLLGFYGEDVLTARIGPLAVDGLMVMASAALVAAAARRVAKANQPPAEPGEREAAEPESEPEVESGRPDVGADNPAAVAPDARPDSPADTTPDTTSATAAGEAPAPAEPQRRAPRAASKHRTATAVARLRRRHPDMSPTEIARRLGVSDRTVRRHLAALRPEPELNTSAAA